MYDIIFVVASIDKEIKWMAGEIKSPPFSDLARVEGGFLLRRLQRSDLLSLPISRPMPSVGANCHELRVRDADHNWRIVYHVGQRHIVVLAIFAKKSQTTPDDVLQSSRRLLKQYTEAES